MNKTFVGFGFGPIQSALFLFEAYQSGNFSRFVVSEVDADLVAAIRNNGGSYTVNIARLDGIHQFKLQGIELYNPRVASDREAIVAAITESDEMATALPSVNIFEAGGEASVVSLLAAGLGRRTAAWPSVLYAAENNNHAAEILKGKLEAANCPNLDQLQVLNTVVGKMCGVISDAATIDRLGLSTITPAFPRAVLVEEFNRILITQIGDTAFQRGTTVFIEKPDLFPFEEAKLYGHNAIHALIAYLGDIKRMTTMDQAGADPEILSVARRAFIDESGAALIKKYAGLNDPLFTPEGFAPYVEDLLVRISNPHLNDLIERVGRDHARKLGYNDRLYGTMRLALSQGVEPKYMALGAAAGLISFIQRSESNAVDLKLPATADELDEGSLHQLLMAMWGSDTDEQAETLIALTWQALQWLRVGFLAPDDE